ncbi:MAG TPA: DUF1629 domain-containing protein [Myxococcales bacterium]|nr:DUF1629 domain-containing protein [Myxococcales bacterium]
MNGSAYVYIPGTKKIDDWDWYSGEPLAKKFPKNATANFDDHYPDRRTLMDFLDNSMERVIASGKVKDILDGLKVKQIEWLPVTVKDHKGKALPDPYFVMNPLGGQDAIDMEKSDVIMDNLIEGDVSRIKKLVLNTKAIDKDAKVFRMNHRRHVILVDDEVHKAFKKAELTGCRMFKAEGWKGLFGMGEEG